MKITWTDAMRAHLVEVLAQGCSYSIAANAIYEKFGVAVSRNSVASRVHRGKSGASVNREGRPRRYAWTKDRDGRLISMFNLHGEAGLNVIAAALECTRDEARSRLRQLRILSIKTRALPYVPESVAVPSGAGIAWLDATDKQCMWPLDPQRVCGCAIIKGAYCEYHYRVSTGKKT